jgi:hypothetical protein
MRAHWSSYTSVGEISAFLSSPLVILSGNSIEIDKEIIKRETILFFFETIIKIK